MIRSSLLRRGILCLGFLLPCVLASRPAVAQTPPAYRYFRAGNASDAAAKPTAGYALMGGGKDLDEAFRWLCERAAGGDLLVLRASGGSDYNPYIQGLCPLNSVATLVIPSRAAASDAFVARTIAHASALFLSGGDQSNYINSWMGTPVQAALQEAIRRGVPVGGTSAGLAVMGEYAYTAQGDRPDDPDLDSRTALDQPWGPRVTLAHGFLGIPILKGIISDTHFAKRNRMGRLLVFLARLNEKDGKPVPLSGPGVRGIGVEERAAVLVEVDGRATVIGHGSAYFVSPIRDTLVPVPGQSFRLLGATVKRVEPGHTFNLRSWTGDAASYTVSAASGEVRSDQAAGAIY